MRKKLESIKSKKFRLNKKEMGYLVGGAKIIESSGEGSWRPIGSTTWIKYSADTVVYDNEADKKHGIESMQSRFFTGSADTDTASRNTYNDSLVRSIGIGVAVSPISGLMLSTVSLSASVGLSS